MRKPALPTTEAWASPLSWSTRSAWKRKAAKCTHRGGCWAGRPRRARRTSRARPGQVERQSCSRTRSTVIALIQSVSVGSLAEEWRWFIAIESAESCWRSYRVGAQIIASLSSAVSWTAGGWRWVSSSAALRQRVSATIGAHSWGACLLGSLWWRLKWRVDVGCENLEQSAKALKDKVVNAYSFFGLKHFLQTHWFHLACLIPAYFWTITCIAGVWSLSPATAGRAARLFWVPVVHKQALNFVVGSRRGMVLVDVENSVFGVTGIDWDVMRGVVVQAEV